MLNKGQRAINRHSPYERGDSHTRRLVNAWESAHARLVVGLVKGGDRPHNVGARSRAGLIASFLTSCTDGPKAAAMGPSCTGNWQLKGIQVENERFTSSCKAYAPLHLSLLVRRRLPRCLRLSMALRLVTSSVGSCSRLKNGPARHKSSWCSLATPIVKSRRSNCWLRSFSSWSARFKEPSWSPGWSASRQREPESSGNSPMDWNVTRQLS